MHECGKLPYLFSARSCFSLLLILLACVSSRVMDALWTGLSSDDCLHTNCAARPFEAEIEGQRIILSLSSSFLSIIDPDSRGRNILILGLPTLDLIRARPGSCHKSRSRGKVLDLTAGSESEMSGEC